MGHSLRLLLVPVTLIIHGSVAIARAHILNLKSHKLILNMPGLTVEGGGKNIEAVSASSILTSVALKQSHTSDTKPHSADLANCEARKDHKISIAVFKSDPLPTSSQADVQPRSISPYISPPVMLLVGGPGSPSRETAPVPFYVHADLLTSISPFFRAAFGLTSSSSTLGCNGYGFQESQTRTMTLPEERPDDVRYLLQWVYWKAVISTSAALNGGPQSTSTSFASWLPNASGKSACPLATFISPGSMAAHTGALWHALIDPPLHALSKYNVERLAVSTAAVHGDISQLTVPKPTPPTFGPLIRLWLLAERLDVRGGLRDEIVERVMEVARVGNCVPGRDDVWLLWEGMDESEHLRGKMRELVIDLYIGMRCWGLFEGEKDCGSGQLLWHGGFLQSLVRRLMWEVHGDWKGLQKGEEEGVVEHLTERTVERGGKSGEVEKEGEGRGEGEWEFVWVGKLRRRRCEYHEHI